MRDTEYTRIFREMGHGFVWRAHGLNTDFWGQNTDFDTEFWGRNTDFLNLFLATLDTMQCRLTYHGVETRVSQNTLIFSVHPLLVECARLACANFLVHVHVHVHVF